MPQYVSPGVYVEEVPAGSRPIEGVGTAVAAFVGLASDGPFNEPRLVTNWTQFTSTFGAFVEDSYLAHSVYGYFNNGGGTCYVVRVGGDGGSSPAARGELPSATDASLVTYRVTARDAGTSGNDITVEVGDPSEGAAEDTFRLVVRRGTQEETYDDLTTKATAQNVVKVINESSALVQMEEVGKPPVAARRPASGTYSLSGGRETALATIDAEDYVGDPDRRTGVGGLVAIDEITMVCAPDLMSAHEKELIDLDDVQAVQQAMIDHCALMKDRMAILDPPRNLNAQQIKEWRVDKTGYSSPYAALYWPWIKVADPLQGGTTLVPPSGHIAGVWSRTDTTRGVHKAPANEVVFGALGLETQITQDEQGLLNPEGINAIRSFPARGIRVWGARTLAGSDSEWKYVSVRRLFNYIEESILEGTHWVVFEPNDFDLWQRIRRTVSAFLLRLWRDGALFGATPEQAFYVKCDEETNPPEGIEAGEVVIEVGIAPVKPAEFVVFRISQLASGGAVSE
jgi:phage tail sheath protein FI